jgi:hypothetical protein
MASNIVNFKHTINGIPFDPSVDNEESYRRALKTQEDEATRLWATMDDQTRDVYVTWAKRALEMLHFSVEAWLPYSLVEVTAGDRIVIMNEIACADVHEAVALLDEAIVFEEQKILERARNRSREQLDARSDDEFLSSIDESIKHGSRVPIADVERLRKLIPEK